METIFITVKNVASVVNGIENEVFTTQDRKLSENQCAKWLDILGECTLIAKKSGLLSVSGKINELKKRVNYKYDKLLDLRLGKIERE